ISFSVIDTGIGIEDYQYEALFESFHQIDNDTDRLYGGTGLGLSITQQLVRLHGGRLDVMSSPGKGATFTVILPRASSDAGRETDSDSSTASTASRLSEAVTDASRVMLPTTQNEKGAHILVVDDEPVNRQVLLNYLALGNFRVSECESGEAALQFVEKHRDLDLVLLDIMMPNMSGYETCRALRKHYSTL